MKKGITLLLFLILLSLVSTKVIQARVDTLWTKTVGGIYGDFGRSVQQTTDGGYILCGETESFSVGYYDVWLIKTNTFGEVLWTKTFGGVYDDRGFSVQQTTDSGYIICGYKDSSPYGVGDIWLIKTDASGEILWNKTFGGSYGERGSAVQQTIDGGYILCGYTFSLSNNSYDIWLIKTDASGDTLWTKMLGGVYEDFGSSVQQTSDGGYIITGILNFGNGFTDVWLIKTNSSGDTLWTKTFGEAMVNEFHSVQQTTDGGYIVTGNLDFGSGNSDIWLLKTDDSGDTLWTKTFGGSYADFGEKIQQTTDGGYIICGYTKSFGAGFYDVWLIKTKASGDTIWTKTFGGGNNDWGEAVQQTTEGGFIIIGATGSFGAGGSDVWLIKTTSDVSHLEQNIDLTNLDYYLYLNYPNPFNPSTKISWQSPVSSWQTLKVYDVLGNEVATLVDEYKPAGKYEIEFKASSLTSGIYFYQLRAENYIETKKMLLIK